MVSSPNKSSSMAESGVPPVSETEGHLPNGLYILTNNLSRTALDLYEGT